MTAFGVPARRAAPPGNPDKDLVKADLLGVCAHYLGAGHRSGARHVFRCPRCGKPNFNAHATRGLAGCFTAECPVPRATDAIGLVAFFEGLDEGRDFREVLRRGREILAVPRRPSAPATHDPYADDPILANRVYGRLLELCPTDERSLRFWRSRGVRGETVERGRFGSIDARRAPAVLAALQRAFSRTNLLSVPGFFERPKGGGLGFTLSAGPYALIPYHDRDGRVTTVEGRFVGRGEPPMNARYLSLRGSGAHLYVFPGFSPDGLLAFTEGPLGAIVAAQEGLAVGAIKGCRSYSMPDGSPLPELAGADLGGRLVPYVPDHDDPPNREVLEEAPKAARALAEPHNGRPALAWLPPGADLDEWLLREPEPAAAFRRLLATPRKNRGAA